MATKTSDIKFHIKNARLSFPALFSPVERTGDNGKVTLKYEASLLMPANDPQVKEIQRALQKAAIDKYGAKGAEIFKALWQAEKVCLRKGDKKRNTDSGEILEGYEGMYYVSASSKVRPTVIDRDRTPLAEGDRKPYSGCYVNAIVVFWAQTGQFGKRINCQLQGVQFVKDGDSFGGGRAASADEFDSLEDEFDGSGGDALDDDMGDLN